MDNPNQFRLLDSLPDGMLEVVFFHLGVASVCRFYNNCSSRELRARTANYLRTRVVKVTAEEVIEGDLDKIDFYEYGQLPRCDIEVETPIGLLKVVLWHLRRVQYESLRFTVTSSNYREPNQQLSLEALVGNVVTLTIDGYLIIDSQDIPTSVKKVELNCRIGPNQDFRHLVNLTHFSGRLNFHTDMENLKLPRSVVTLGLPNYRGRAFDASSLPNLKHIKGGNIVKIPWEQIETVALTENTGADKLQLNSTGQLRSFKHNTCPKLKEVVYYPPMKGGDVSELFTDDQLSRLTFLWGRRLTISNMDRFEHLTKVFMRLNEDLTTDFRLPPNVIDFAIESDHSVYGVPPQVKVFSHLGDAVNRSNIHVNVKSAKLKSLSVVGAKSVTIDCRKLTTLKLIHVDNVGDVKAPLVWKLHVDHTIFPVLAANPDGSDKFIWLKDLEIEGTIQDRDQAQAQDVVLKPGLRSVTLFGMVLGRVSITANKVTFDYCRFVENAGPPEVEAKVLSIENMPMDTSHVWCQELCIMQDDDYGIVFVPRMVEKLITNSVNLAVDNNTRGHGDGRVRLGLSGCNKLRSVEFDILHFEDNQDEAFIIPASVRLVVIGEAEWQQGTLRFEEGSQLEHIECWSPATMGQLGLTTLPPSLFHAPAIPYYALERLRPH